MSYHHRTQDYVFSGALHGMVGLTDNVGGGGYFLGSNGTFVLDISNLVEFYIVFDANDHGGMGERIPMHLTCHWTGAFLTGASDVTVTNYPIDAPVGPVTVDLDGTYTVTVHDCWEVVTITDGASIAATAPNLCDTLPADRALNIQMQVKSGQTITATATYGGLTVTSSCTASSDFDLLIASTADVTALAARVVDASMRIDMELGGIAETTGGGTFHNTVRTAQWGSTVEATSSISVAGIAEVRYILSGLVQYDWQCEVNALDAAYPASLVAVVTVGFDPSTMTAITQDVTLSGGSGSLAIEQKSYQLDVIFDGSNVHSEAVDNLWPVSAVLQGASLSAAGEDTDLASRALWMRGWLWAAASLDQASSLDALLGTWTATGGISTITVPASSFAASLLGSSWSGADLSGFAFADLYLTADAAAMPARVHLGAKYWDVVVGLTGSVRIDLCSPTSTHAAIDTTDSIYPLIGPSPYGATEGWGTGVHNAPSLVIDNLATGHIYILAKVTLLRVDHARATFLDPFKAWIVATTNTVSGVTTTTSYRSWLTGDTDAAPSLEQTDAAWIHSSAGGGSDTISPASISAAVASVNGSSGAYPSKGWSATNLQTPDGTGNLYSGYLNSDREAVLLLAGGLWYDGSAWQSGIGQSVPLSSIKAQLLFNSIVTYAGCGDVWGWAGGGLGAAVKLRPAIILRGQATGIVTDVSALPRSGVVVNVKDSTSHASRGSGTTDTRGQYLTGSPWVQGNSTADVMAAGSSTASAQLFPTRKRRRFCFTVARLLKALAALEDQRGYWEGEARDDGTLQIERAWSAELVLADTFVIDSNTDCNEPSLCMNTHTGQISVVYRRGDGSATPYAIYRSTSDDDGATWLPTPPSGPYKAGAGSVDIKHSDEVFNQRTEERLFFYNDGSGGSGTGLIQIDIFDPMGVLVGTFPTGGMGIGGLTADDSSFGATYIQYPTSTLGVSFVVSGARRRFRSVDDGRTWGELT